MAENNEREETCKLNDSIASWLVFIMVAGVIGCTLFYMVYNLCSSPDIQHVVIRVEKGDSICQGISAEESYTMTGIDSLINVVNCHEKGLEEKYQYLLESKEEEERFKTWGTLIVGVIVSVCSFWGYKSMKDLRSDIEKNTEKTADLAVKVYLDAHLQNKVKEELSTTLKSEIVGTIKQHVFDTLSSTEDPIVKTKIREGIESEEFEKRLEKVVREKINEELDNMHLLFMDGIRPKGKATKESYDTVQFT